MALLVPRRWSSGPPLSDTYSIPWEGANGGLCHRDGSSTSRRSVPLQAVRQGRRRGELSQAFSENLRGGRRHGRLDERALQDQEPGACGASLRFDMRELRRRGFVQPGARRAGAWSWSRGGEKAGSIGFVIDLTDPDCGFAVLSFSVNGESRSQRIAIVADPCRYGGRRFYFHCPLSYQRCEVLCGVGGVFATREHHRLAYASQSEDRLGRMRRAAGKAEARFLAKDGRPFPRGANADRLRERWVAYEEACEEELALLIHRRFGRYGLSL